MTSVGFGHHLGKLAILFSSLPLLFLSILGHTATVQLNDQTQRYQVGLNLEYLIDAKNKLTIKDIASSAKTSFTQNKSDTLSLGYTRSTVWVKLDIDASALSRTSEPWITEIDFPPLDEITFYQRNANGKYIPLITGDLFDFSNRDIKTTSYAFNINLSPDRTNTFYFKVKSQSSMRIPINVYSQAAFIQQLDLRKTGYGIYGGIIFAMLFYNFLLYLTTRDRSYLYYILYVSSFVLYQINLNGLGHQYFWHTSPWWSNQGLALSIACVGLFGPLFTRSFLQTEIHTPILHKVLAINAILAAGLAAWSLVANNYTDVIQPVIILTLATLLLTLAAGIINFLKKNHMARFFLLASVSLIIGGITESLTAIAVIPSNIVTNSASLYGFIIFSLLLSFALADRINFYRNEKTKAEKEARQNLILANKNLAHSNKIKNDFLATVSYELHTPMNGIIGNLNLIKNAGVSKQVGKYVSSATEYAAEMVLMIEELLGISEVQSNNRLDRKIFVDQSTESLSTNASEEGEENQAKLASNKTFDILIVEDNPVHQMLIKSILLNLNYRVHSASNGQEAL
ncbi:MAG: hypothetical protein JKY67_12510, partial [Pseudomonadales bacterium]|nr:hypothetical protein [Pseudomonadales bacterium]